MNTEPTVLGIPLEGFLLFLASLGVIAVVLLYVTKQGREIIEQIIDFIRKLFKPKN